PADDEHHAHLRPPPGGRRVQRPVPARPPRAPRGLGRDRLTPIPYTDADVAYVTREFVALEDLCQAHGHELATVRENIEQSLLPRPTYVLPDGSEMVPESYFTLAEEAVGVGPLRADFERRGAVAAATDGVDFDAM